jgi:hypothetical protein
MPPAPAHPPVGNLIGDESIVRRSAGHVNAGPSDRAPTATQTRAPSPFRRRIGREWGDLVDGPALRDDAVRLGELRLTALEDRLAGDLEAGLDRSVTGDLRALAAEHPFRERLRAMLVVALHRQGRSSEVVSVPLRGG